MRTANINGDEYRIGLKNIYDLFPGPVKERIVAEKKRTTWDAQHKQAAAQVARQIDRIEAANTLEVATAASSGLSALDKLKKEDQENLLEWMTSMDKKFADIRTTFDCVLFRVKDNSWTVVVDTSETGDLSKAITIGEYSKTQQLESVDEHLTISVNVHGDGDLVEFVGLCCKFVFLFIFFRFI